jgi:hypothetical protein
VPSFEEVWGVFRAKTSRAPRRGARLEVPIGEATDGGDGPAVEAPTAV